MKYDFIVELAFYIPLLPAALAVFKWRSMHIHQRWFAILLWAIVAISFSSRIYTEMTNQNNMPFFHCYILVEYLLLLLVFRHMFNRSIKDLVWWILAGGFSIVWLVNIFAGEGWWGFPDYIHALEAGVVLVIISIWFRKMLKEKIISKPEHTFEFWICAGLLIFFSGNLLLFIFPKFLLNARKEVFAAVWVMSSILIIILYTFYTIALLWVKKTVK
jgi:hypothetical protein